MNVLQIETAEVFAPLLEPARDKAAWGGRGSGKSHFFAGLMTEDALRFPGDAGEGLRGICGREIQKSLKDSAKHLIESKIAEFGLGEADGFKIYNDRIATPGDGILIFQGLQDHTAESIKSLEGFHRFWGEEAQKISARSVNLIRPTIRWESARLALSSEMWWSWNPLRKVDAVDVMFRGATLPTGAVVVRANWSDNPWFPKVLEQERLDCLKTTPDQYDYIWEGGYATVLSGAYYAKCLAEAKAQNRIGKVGKDPLMTIRAYWDIGGTGAKADACAIWIVQFIGREIRVLDYYEAVGQPLAAHVTWLRKRGYEDALCVLPHDGATNDRVHDVSYESALRDAGFEVRVIPNQGKGAAANRIEAARRLFPSVWFNEDTTEAGRDALGWYHEKQDEARNVGLGPEHDWSSHGCFHGATEVLTRYGTCQIMNLPQNGEILTPCGWKPYILPRITKRSARLVEVAFTDGYSVKCTPDHLFLTDSGWKSAECLTPNTAIRSTLMRSRNISMAASTVCGRVRSIFHVAADASTAMFGGLLSDQFRAVAISTIGTATSSTIGLKISNAFLLPSTFQSRGLSELNRLTGGFRQRHGTRPPSGISRQKVSSGISGKPSGPRAGLSGSEKKSPANSAVSFIWRLFVKAGTLANTALRHARLPLIGSAAKRTSTHVAIANVKHLSETADVWDITVPDGHWFSLANGAVVHNSDAFGLMAVDYEDPGKKKAFSRDIVYPDLGIA